MLQVNNMYSVNNLSNFSWLNFKLKKKKINKFWSDQVCHFVKDYIVDVDK